MFKYKTEIVLLILITEIPLEARYQLVLVANYGILLFQQF